MEASRRAHAVYGDARAAVKSASQIEYQAFARITQDLNRTSALDQSEFPRLAEALHENLRLWTIVAGDVAANDNNLPEALRARLFYLAEFTRNHTGKVLKGEAQTAALIEINTAVMKGLRLQQEAAPCPA